MMKATLDQIAQLTRLIADGTFDYYVLDAILNGQFTVADTSISLKEEPTWRDRVVERPLKMVSPERQLEVLSHIYPDLDSSRIMEVARSMRVPEGADGVLIMPKPTVSLYPQRGHESGDPRAPNGSLRNLRPYFRRPKFESNPEGLRLDLMTELAAYYAEHEKQTPGDYLALLICLNRFDLQGQAKPMNRHLWLDSYAIGVLIATHSMWFIHGESIAFEARGDVPVIINDRPYALESGRELKIKWENRGEESILRCQIRGEEEAEVFSLRSYWPCFCLDQS